jgi:hypothetical protein
VEGRVGRTSAEAAGWRAYFASTLFGAALALWLYPIDFLLPTAGGDAMIIGDAAQQAIA